MSDCYAPGNVGGDGTQDTMMLYSEAVPVVYDSSVSPAVQACSYPFHAIYACRRRCATWMPVIPSPSSHARMSPLVPAQSLSHVQLFATTWTVASQAPLSMGFSRQENWNVLPFPTPGQLPYPAIKSASFTSPALAGRFITTGAT